MDKQEFAPKESKRTVSVYSTTGTCQLEFESGAKTWGQLKKELTEKSIVHNSMKAVIGENQEELTKDEQEILQQNISLFLTPIRVKSGEIL